MVIPEIQILKIIKGIVSYIEADYRSKLLEEVPEESFLFKVFNGIALDKFDFYQQAISFFIRNEDHPRKINIRLFFDSEKANLPTIHLNLPSERPSFEGMSGDVGYQDPVFKVVEEQGETPVHQFQDVITRTYESSYNIIFTSDNTFEVLLMYYAVKAGLQAFFKSVSVSGFDNIKIGGGDLTLNSDLVPVHIFARLLTISFNYETSVPEGIPQQFLTDIVVKGKVII